jgi:hypothetical protein
MECAVQTAGLYAVFRASVAQKMLCVRPMRLPDHVRKVPQPASLVCPECGGALAVQAEGDAEYLLFICQVGHSYSATTLLSEKEERLEEVLWSGVYSWKSWQIC